MTLLPTFLSLSPVSAVPTARVVPAPSPAHPARLTGSVPVPVQGAVHKAVTPQDIQNMANAYLQACEHGVDLAKASFMSKLLGVGTAAAIAGVAVALTVATHGATAPLVAVLGTRFLIAAADAACAWRCWRDAKAAAAGRAVENPLPLGANAIGNLLHKALRSCGLDAGRATRYATTGSALVSVGLSAAALGLGLFAPAADLAGKITRLAAGGAAALLFPFETYALCKEQVGKPGRQEALKALDDAVRQYVSQGDTNQQAQRKRRILAALHSQTARDRATRDLVSHLLQTLAPVNAPKPLDLVNAGQTHFARTSALACGLTILGLGARSLA